jgi:EpsI family protein
VEPWILDSAASLRRNPALLLTLAALLLAFAACYRSCFQALAVEWSSSETYSHGPLVPWIALALVWMRRDRIRRVRLAPNLLLGGALVAVALAAKVLGFVAGATVVEGSSLIPLLAGILVLFGGVELLRVLLLPLLYLLFMIPVWAPLIDRLTPLFRHFSAWMGVHLASAVGVPVGLEGYLIKLPQTTLLVADACSGVNYLIAVTAVGIPLAWFSFPDLPRRLTLLALGIAIAILANGLRVTLIIVLLHGGLIHDVHGPGHMFQGLSVALMGYVGLFLGAWALGRFWPGPASGPIPPATPPPGFSSGRSPWPAVATAAVLAMVLAVPAYWQAKHHVNPVPLPRPLTALPTTLDTWRATEGALPAIPMVDFPGSDRLERVYWSPSGARVSLLLIYVPDQSGSRELVGYRTAPLLRGGTGVSLRAPSGGSVSVTRSESREDDAKIVTFAWYDVGGHVTGSPWRAKAQTAWNVITQHRSDASLVAVQARYAPGVASVPEGELRGFVASLLGPLRSTLHDPPLP